MARNFRTHLESWNKVYKFSKKGIDKSWREKYCGLIRKLMTKAEQNLYYYKKHINNAYYHMVGFHDHCDKEFYCTDKHQF